MELSPNVEDRDLQKEKVVWVEESPRKSLPTPEPDSCSRVWAKLVEEERKSDDRLAQERLDILKFCLMEIDEKNGVVPPAESDAESDNVSATVHDDSDDEGHECDELKVDHPQECASQSAESRDVKPSSACADTHVS